MNSFHHNVTCKAMMCLFVITSTGCVSTKQLWETPAMFTATLDRAEAIYVGDNGSIVVIAPLDRGFGLIDTGLRLTAYRVNSHTRFDLLPFEAQAKEDMNGSDIRYFGDTAKPRWGGHTFYGNGNLEDLSKTDVERQIGPGYWVDDSSWGTTVKSRGMWVWVDFESEARRLSIYAEPGRYPRENIVSYTTKSMLTPVTLVKDVVLFPTRLVLAVGLASMGTAFGP